MSLNNPVPLIRDVSSAPEHGSQVHVIQGKAVSTTTAGNITVETGLKSVIGALIFQVAATPAVLAATIATSSTMANTIAVQFTVATGATVEYVISGLLDRPFEALSADGGATVVYRPLSSK